MSTKEQLAKQLYEKYCAGVGGKAFNGDPLPDWETFRADEAKRKQSDAWLSTAEPLASALGFYAEKHNWCAPRQVDADLTPTTVDGGQRARAVLGMVE